MNHKQLSLMFIIGVFVISSLSFVSALTTTRVFSDGFETNNFATVWTSNAKYSRDGTGLANHTGLFGIIADGGTANVLMNITNAQNVSNQTNCTLSAAMQIHLNLDGGEYLCLDYSSNNGSTWNMNTGGDGVIGGLCQDGNVDTETAWRNVTYSFSATGINAFRFRFRLNTNNVNEDGYIDDVNLTCSSNIAPVISNITASHTVIKGGNTLTIFANTTTHGVNDTEADTLFLYCDNSTTPNSTNTDCTGGTTSDATYPYALTCTFATPTTNAANIEFCRIYDGASYSSIVPNITYTTDSSAPTTSIISVAGDTIASYYDSVNDGRTNITISGEASMSCRWSSSDVVYSSMTNDCIVGGTQANCSIDDVASQGFTTRYISCQDNYTNSQNTSQNLDVSFYLDYTAPNTTDNSVATVQVPNYIVTITELDNVDSDPTSFYCTSTTQGCDPTTSIDNGGTITYTSSNRGINYLRYYSVDDANNTQVVVNKTININRLPLLISASDDAVIIKGGATVNITTFSNDSDSGQEITLRVCNSSGANLSSCSGGTYCNTTGTSNLSCTFASETDSASHTWYAYIFDEVGEGATNNSITGSYTTDSTAPIITLSSPTNASTITQSSVTFTIVVNEALTNAWYSLNNGANVSMSNTSLLSYTHSNTSIGDGIYNMTFWANDSYGNIGSLTGNYFTINTVPSDTTPPAITILTPGNASYTSTSPLLNITADEALNWAGYKLNGGSLTTLSNLSSTNWYTTLSLSSETTNTVIVYANDTSNNQNNKTIVFYADSSAPRYSNALANPSPANVSQDVNCSIFWTDGFNITSVKISENSTGAHENHTISFSGTNGSASYLIVGSKLTNPGSYQCIFYATDIAGNTNSTSVSFNVNDVTAPTITIISPSNLTYNTENISISIITSENASSAWYSLSGNPNVTMGNTSLTSWNSTLTSLSNGGYNIIFYANDTSNNVGNSSLVSFTVNTVAPDTTPPIITITTIANASYKGLTNVALNITTNENISHAKYSLNGAANVSMSNSSMTNWNATLPTLSQESTNTLVVYANDTSNNLGNTTVTFYADTLAPRFYEVSATPNPANESQNVICNAYVNDTFTFSNVKISENATIPGTFLNHTISLSSKGYANYTITNVQKGNFTCIFYATDAAGNVNSTSVLFNVSDVTAPILTINSPLNQSYSSSSILLSITSNENLSSANYTLDEGVTNSTLSGSGLSWSKTVTIANGAQKIIFYGFDTSGNQGNSSVSFNVDTTANDLTPPTITVWSPTNNSYDIDGNIILNITTDEALSWAGYKLDTGSLTTLGNVSSTNWNATVTSLSEGQYNVTFYANDSSVNKNQANKTSRIWVDLNNPSVNSFSCTDAGDSADVICSATLSDAIGLSYAIIGYDATGSWQNSSSISLSGTSDSLSYTIAAGNTTPPSFTAQIYLYDLSGRNNLTSSDSVLISDDTFPEIYNITYYPNTTALLDPGTRVNINATISEDYNISTVVLMYRNSSTVSWTSVTMTNLTAITYSGATNTIYNASFIPQNETWYFKINATDTAGNQNISSIYTLIVENDTSQNITTTITAVESITYAQRTNNNSLGNLVMNNTGDGTLNFNVSLNSSNSNIQSRLSINDSGNQTANYSASSGNAVNITINVNTTGLTSGLYDYNITIASEAGTEVLEKKLNIQTADGAYLSISIDTFSSSVTTSQTGVTYAVSVTNLGTADATGVYLNWTLPSIFSLASGSLSRSLGTIPIGGSGTNTITVDVASSTADITYYINATATATNADSVNTSKAITVSNPITITSTTTTTTTGGGGGGAATSEAIVYKKTVEIVRGGKQEFNIEISNKYANSSLKDLTIKLSGYPEQYIKISPGKISQIGPGEKANFVVSLQVPSYKGYEEHDLKAIITGEKITNGQSSIYTETQYIKLIIQEIDSSNVKTSLLEAEKAIEEMRQKGFCISTLEPLLIQAKEKLNESKNKEAADLAKEIISLKEKAFGVNNLMKRIIDVLNNPKNARILLGDSTKEFKNEYTYSDLRNKIQNDSKVILTGNAIVQENSINELLDLAILAFERCDYDLAEERANEAKTLLLLEIKGNFVLFMFMYWPFILGGIGISSLGGIIGYRRYKKSNISKRIEDLNTEEDNIRKLIMSSQTLYFSGKISVGHYENNINQYNQRIAEIRKKRLTLRNKRIKLLGPQQIVQDLSIESLQIEGEIKRLQEKYYKEGKISEREYKRQFEILNERLAENEGERSTLDFVKKKELMKKTNDKPGEFLLEKKDEKKIQETLKKDTREFREKQERQEEKRIRVHKFFSFLKKPLEYLKSRKERKRIREERNIKEKVDKMLSLN